MMSELDTLIVTFQTQLSDVMETVVKTAMYEVTRLVEDGFLEEVKRRNQEVESLKMQLQWAENKLSDQDGKESKNKRCGEVELSTVDKGEESSKEQQDGNLTDGVVKTEANSVEKRTRSSRREVLSASPQAAGDTSATLREGTSEAPDKGVKEEVVKKLSCSAVCLGGWCTGGGGGFGAEAGPELHSTGEASETQPKQSAEELLRDVIKQDRQASPNYAFPEDLEDTHMGADQSHTSSVEPSNDWTALTAATAGLLQNQRLAADKDCDPARTRGNLKRTERICTSLSVDVCAPATPGRDHITSPGSPEARARSGSALGVMIKQEVVVDSYGCEEIRHTEKKMKKSPFSCSLKQHNRVSCGAQKQNHMSHKASAQEQPTGPRLQAALQHLHRPMKKPSHTLSSPPPAAHSQAASFNRLSCASKAAASPPLAVQRVQLGNKQSAALNRAGEPWVSVKSVHQSSHSYHANPLPDPDSLPHSGPRHLLHCGQCGKCFPHPSNLKAHLQTHTGERPFCCSLCGRSFTKLSNLKAHRRVHTGERPYCCLACGKRFTQKCNLKRHQRIHLDV